jgi:hypothetical protein
MRLTGRAGTGFTWLSSFLFPRSSFLLPWVISNTLKISNRISRVQIEEL